MKQRALIAGAMILMAFSACHKERNKSVSVVRNCTGVYLRFEGKDYHVCNPEKVAGYADNASLTATFRHLDECNGSAKDAIVCMMAYPNEGWIEVDRVK